MGELESLLLVLAAIYLTECAVWVPSGAVAFCGWWRAKQRPRHPVGVLANSRGAIFPANPFPPLHTVFVSVQYPVSLSADGAYSYTAAGVNPGSRPPQVARYVRFCELRSAEARRKQVWINGKMFLQAASPCLALHWTRLIRKLQEASASRREAMIRDAVAGSFDALKIQDRLKDYATRARSLRILGVVLFVFLFGVAPALAWTYGLGHIGLFLLAGSLVQTISIALLFRRAHRAIFPDAEEERLTRFLTMLLAPPTAIRASDLLGRRLLEAFHPVAVARVICAPGHFRIFARNVLLDLRHPFLPVMPTDALNAQATEDWFRQETMAAVERTMREAGLDPAELTQPPPPTEPVHRGYCPRCLAQFVTADACCADCGGRPLQPLKPAGGPDHPHGQAVTGVS